MKNKAIIIVLILSLLTCLVTTASGSGFNPDEYSEEELLKIREMIDARVNEEDTGETEEEPADEAASQAASTDVTANRKIEFSDKEIIVYKGKTTKINAAVSNLTEDAPKKTALIWTIEDNAIATVTSAGQITGKVVGSTVITVSAKDDPSIANTISIHVVASVESVTLADKTVQLLIKDDSKPTYQLNPTILPENALDPSLSWTSSDEDTVTVDENGLITGHKAGKATITAQTNDASLKAPKKVSCTVTVMQAVTELKVVDEEINIGKGKKGIISVEIIPETATQKKLNWSSSDNSVAIVDQKGNITGKAGGDCVITCTTTDGSDLSQNFVVHVIQQVTAIKTDQKNNTIDIVVGQTKDINIDISPENATIKDLIWRSSNFLIAAAGEWKNNRLTIIGNIDGTASITGTAKDGSGKTISLTVNVEPKFTLENPTGNKGKTYGTPWFSITLKNTSKTRTIDAVTIRYYAEDAYGHKIKGFGFGDYEYEETLNITIGPGKTKKTDRIKCYQFESAKYIHYSLVSIHYQNGQVETTTPDYYYFTY